MQSFNQYQVHRSQTAQLHAEDWTVHKHSWLYVLEEEGREST